MELKKPGGVAADDGIRVVLVHRSSTGNAENDHHDNDDGETDDEGEDGDDLKTQQTPKEEAQVPLAVPPADSHSLELGDGKDEDEPVSYTHLTLPTIYSV